MEEKITLTIQEISDWKEGRKTLEQIQLEKCKVTLKSIRELLAPVLNRIAIPSTEGDGSYEFVRDTIARFYRDNFNKGGDDYGGSNITRETHTFKGESEFTMTLRNQAKYGNSIPSELDMQSQLNNGDYLAVKINNGGLTISVLEDGNASGNNAVSRRARNAIAEMNERLAVRFWDDPKSDRIWEDCKRGKITKKQRDLKIRRNYTSLLNHNMETRNLNYSFKKDKVPVTLYHIDIPTIH